jgi:hypothetical protein
MKQIQETIKSSALALLTLALPCSLMASPTIVQIDASHEGAPTTTVLNSEAYNIYVGPGVSNPDIEYGALVDLLGVDSWYEPPYQSVIPDQGWRFTDPKAPDQTHSATYIIWIGHDYSGPLWNGDLQVGFNSRKPGTGYYNTPGPNPPPGADVNAGPVQSDWVTIYSDDTLVLQFKGFKIKQP